MIEKDPTNKDLSQPKGQLSESDEGKFTALFYKGINPNRKEILNGLDLATATQDEIDERYDQALAEALEEHRQFFPRGGTGLNKPIG